MKKLLTAIGLTAMLVAPALAAPARHHDGRPSHAQSATVPSDVVVYGGQVIGQDPDPNVRLQIRRDAFSWEN
jgi:hypothetical protein